MLKDKDMKFRLNFIIEELAYENFQDIFNITEVIEGNDLIDCINNYIFLASNLLKEKALKFLNKKSSRLLKKFNDSLNNDELNKINDILYKQSKDNPFLNFIKKINFKPIK